MYSEEFFCPFCSSVCDSYGDHALVCSCKGDRTRRHNAERNGVLYQSLSAGLTAEIERPGLLPPRIEEEGPAAHEATDAATRASGRRPADVYIPRWHGGIPAALDLAISSGLRSDALRASAMDGSSHAKAYAQRKKSFLDTSRQCAEQGLTFVPMVLEAHGGGWGAEARRVLSTLAHKTAAITGEMPSVVSERHAQQLSVLLQKKNSRAVLCRQPDALAAQSRWAYDAAAELRSSVADD